MPHLDVRYVTREGLESSPAWNGFLTNDNRHSPNLRSRGHVPAVAAAGARVLMDGHGGDYTVNPRGQNALARMLCKGQLRRFLSEFGAMRRHLRQSVNRPWCAMCYCCCSRRRPGCESGYATATASPYSARSRCRGMSSKPGARRDGRDCDACVDSQRVAMERALRRQQNFPAQAYSVAGATHGLEFTQPFHDKRVVEFGLAIPEELYVKNGKTRYLARAALKDLYPPEYQDRPPGNDDFGPDFLVMAKRAEPRVLAEIERMEKAGRLSRYFDFPRMRAMLTRRRVGEHASGNEADTRHAMLAFLAARYVEWFRGDNA